MGGFIGYPIGGLLGAAVAGLSDLPTASVIGAGVAVAVIAGFQAMALGLRSDRPTALRWVGISAIAGAVGWLVARAIVPAADGVIDALVVGGVSGLAIGIGQLVAMGSRGRVWLLWPPAFALAWAAGNAVSTSIGVDTAAWPVFGASGALVAQGILLGSMLLMTRRAGVAVWQAA